MRFRTMFQPNLRRLILDVVVLTALVMLATAFHASYSVQRQMLIDAALEANLSYSSKLAEGAEGFLDSAQQQLAHSAKILGSRFHERGVLNEESERLHAQTDSFNAVGVTDAAGIIRATAPANLPIVGTLNESAGGQQALHERKPLVSAPYLSPAGNLIVFISHPIFSPDREYRGYIGGAVYLKQENILNKLLGHHYYRDGSYLYVVDQSRRLLYHPDPSRIGTLVAENKVVDDLLAGGAGSSLVRNSRGIEMLAGYAPVRSAGWGIVSQRPLDATLEPLEGLMLSVLIRTAPTALVALLGVWALAYFISRPLSLLAGHAHRMDVADAAGNIENIRSWYFEASELKKAMLVGIGLLQKKLGAANLDAQTDPLTGLVNRRGLDLAIQRFVALQRSFSVIAIDIDHFKRVNDTYGHDVGDLVLKKLGAIMKAHSRPDDVLCRNGGEEFVMLLPETSTELAIAVATRLRKQIEVEDIPHVGRVTVSMGIAIWPEDHASVDEVLKLADLGLYKAKQAGRHCVVKA
jgi:diguanylate cyclase (GGDEF)-like protein